VLLTVYCIVFGGVNPLRSGPELHISGVCMECVPARGALSQEGIFMCSQVAPGCRTAVQAGVVFVRFLFWYEPVFLVVFLDL
jgi:hypothetical protein